MTAINKLDRRQFLKATGILAGSLAATSVAGCAQPVPAPAAPAAPAATAIPAVSTGLITEKVDPITILINDSPWFPGFEKLVRLYEEKSGNKVNLAVTPFAGMLEKTRNATTASESEYDIVNLNEGWYAPFFAGKFIAPIPEIDPNYKLDPSIIHYKWSTHWNHEKGYSAEDGIWYGLPINGNIQLLYYRSDLFEQAGLKAPETWDDLEAAAKKFHDGVNMYGFSMRGQKAGWATGFDWLNFLRSHGADWVANPGVDWSVTINNAKAKAGMARCLGLLKAYGPANIADVGQAEMIQLFTSGKLAQGILVVASAAGMDDPEKSTVVGKIAYSVTPRALDGVKAPASGIWVMGVPRNLPIKRQQAGLTFLKWALDKDAQMEYTRFGAVPVRQDVYTSELATETKYRWMKAMADSTPFIAENIRVPEGPQITDSIELRVNEAISGQLTGDQACDKMAEDIFGILDKAGYKTKIG